jgi:hypothetical protein
MSRESATPRRIRHEAPTGSLPGPLLRTLKEGGRHCLLRHSLIQALGCAHMLAFSRVIAAQRQQRLDRKPTPRLRCQLLGWLALELQ